MSKREALERQEVPIAKQRFDIPEWVESDLSQINLPIAVSEIIDNAIDETPERQTTSMLITFDAKSDRVVFENSNTTGMDVKKMKEFPIWAGKHKDPGKIKEHRLGGKLAILWLLSKDGNCTVTSRPLGSEVAFQMHMEKWWQRLSPEEEFEIKTIERKEEEKEGVTRFELRGVKSIPSNVADLADKLGLTYGPLVQEGRLTIKLRRYPPRGKGIEIADVLPVTIPFDDNLSSSKNKVPTGRKGQGPKINVKWGLLDQERKKRDETSRRNLYDTKNVTQIRGDTLYVYYLGRLLSQTPLSSLRIPGHTTKHIFNSFVVTVNIEEGWAPKTVLKTSLSMSASETKDIHKKIVSLIEKDVRALVKDVEDEIRVPKRYQERTKQASTALAAVLNEVFDNNPRLIADTFNLPTSGYEREKPEQGKEQKKKTKKKRASLPGFGSPRTKSKKKREKQESGGEKKERAEKNIWVNPIPEFSITPFSENSPEARVTIHQETGKPLIELNYTNPSVHIALQQRGGVFKAELLRMGAIALYHEKWVRIEPENSLAYFEGVQRDVAKFLATASELKVI